MASNYDGYFVKVRPQGSSGAYTNLPTPSTYKMTSSTFVDSGRNSEGVVIAQVIRAGVRQIVMSWNFLTQAQYTLIASFFDTNFMFECKYYDTITGTYQTKDMYVSDRISDSAQMKCDYDANGEITAIKGYVGSELTLVEV